MHTVLATSTARNPAACLRVTLLVLALLALPAMADTPTTPFTQHVRANFQRWDTDKDGTLSMREIEAASMDPSVQGEDAAALVTLHDWSQDGPWTGKDRPGFAWTLQTLDSYEQDVAAHRKPKVDFDKTYKGRLKKLAAANRSLFAPGAPNLDHVGQGGVGDCYFVAAAGCWISQRPEDIHNQILPQEGGGYRVHLPGWGDEVVRDPTDAEVMLYSQNSRDGMWFLVLDKAVSALRSRRFSFGEMRHTVVEDPLELDFVGWGSKPLIWAFTGHTVTDLSFWKNPTRQVPGIEQQARQLLVASVGSHRVMCTGAKPGKDPLPRGIERGHVYAVLNYDRGSDMVTIWNPWGNNLHAQPEKPMAGYETKHGRFLLSLHDFVNWFGGFSYEKDH